jgi:hypothetical protein
LFLLLLSHEGIGELELNIGWAVIRFEKSCNFDKMSFKKSNLPKGEFLSYQARKSLKALATLIKSGVSMC